MKTVLVVSDLHLGGPDGFQMCPPAGAENLTAFFQWACELQKRQGDVSLVIAGDVVDFLAEPDDERKSRERWTWSAFAEEALALAKLERILARTASVWRALSQFVAASGELSVLLGNHDVELSLPRVRHRLLEALAPAGGKVSFLYDGEAYSTGELVVDHGNRYDGWNVVAHDSLRHARSALSRREKVPLFPAQPGSRLVAEVMNRIKTRYAFVDLLKPETSGVLPILAVLDGELWGSAGRAIANAAKAAWRQAQLGPEGPRSSEFIRATSGASQTSRGAEMIGGPVRVGPEGGAGEPFPDEALVALADELARSPRREMIGAVQELEIGLLLRAFRARGEKDASELDVNRETTLYCGAAEALAQRGFRVVVFGHTHLAKRVDLGVGGKKVTYLNTGTWADLMRLRRDVYEGSTTEGETALKAFLEAVRNNELGRYRRQVPTFARVELDEGGHVWSGDVFFFEKGAEPERLSTEGLTRRLDTEAPR